MIDKNKKYRTHDGSPVRIYAIDGGGLYPVHGAILCAGVWLNYSWTRLGFQREEDGPTADSDLVEVIVPKDCACTDCGDAIPFDEFKAFDSMCEDCYTENQ